MMKSPSSTDYTRCPYCFGTVAVEVIEHHKAICFKREFNDDPTAGLAIKYKQLPANVRFKITFEEFLTIARALGHETGEPDGC